ncbi:MAG TPA: Holliday junction resolvase RuvX [Solirubrobacterales bacterium]|nr:Holliday junction resolvase RuvX [Solirubrobacterales bacterium]
MRVLAIDHGLARCGCAISDPTGTIVRPLDVVEPPDAGAVADVAKAERAERVVVGLPLSLDGTEGEQAQLVREFCEQLAAAVQVPVETWDERLTTAMAGASRRSGARAAEDSLAAAHLLDSYLAAAARPEAAGERGEGTR